MQYYRLWIYSCNVVLGLTSAIFIIFAAFVVSDVRLSLLEGVELYHPTFFYAYGALILQCGVVQTIGCLGAQRLSHKLLSLYWTLLLLLTLGDVGVGLYWVFHLEKVKVNLHTYLSKEFIDKYSRDEVFTLRWNKIQSQDRCCGVDGPFDFEKFRGSQLLHSKQSAFTSNSHVILDVETNLLVLPESCCTRLYVPPTVSGSSSGGTGLDTAYRVTHYPLEEEHSPYNDQSPESAASGSSYSNANDELHFHTNDYAGDGGGGGRGRRGRTVINFPHKNDEPHQQHSSQQGKTELHLLQERNEEADFINGFHDRPASEIDTNFYDKDYVEDSPDQSNDSKKPYENKVTAVVDVPDDHTSGDNHEIQASLGPIQAYSAAVEKRDIKTYEPIHTHKVRHELHRKSHPASSLIDSKAEKNNTNTNASLVIAHSSNESKDGLFAILKSSTTHKIYKKKTREKHKNWRDGVTNDKRQQQLHLHHHQRTIHNFNQMNKLFPSIEFSSGESQQKEGETKKALYTSSSSSPPSSSSLEAEVTQVPNLFLGGRISPSVESDSKTTQPVCHEQLEGLNYHNSYRKDLLDQRKTRRVREDNKDFLRRRKHSLRNRTRRKTTSSPTHIYMLTSVEMTDKIEANKIGETTKKNKEKTTTTTSLLAKLVLKKSDRVMSKMSASPSTPSTLPLRSSSSSSSSSSSNNDIDREKNLVRRATDIILSNNGGNDIQTNANLAGSLHTSSSTFSLLSASSSSPIMSGRNEKLEGDNSGKSYLFPRSSLSSSTIYVEANTTSIISPSSSHLQYGDDSWNEDERVNGSQNDNNITSPTSGAQEKRLYAYGVGCGVKLIEWVDHVSGIMFILGFCIIGFAKTCFLVILRTEIREMIEKINMIEPEEIMSPSRTVKSGSLAGDQTRFHQVSHPLLQNPHRASTVSAQGILLPTIKSPDGPSSSFITGGMGGGYTGGGFGLYNRPNRHYLRRASNIVGGDRSRSHSNETVNMSLLMTSQGESGAVREKGHSNPNIPSSAGGSSGTIANLEEKDPVSGLSITVPSSTSSSYVCQSSAASAAARYLRRSSTCSSSTNPSSFPYQFGFDGEPRPGPSSRFYQYFEPVYQPTHLYQQHHHHHYMRNRSHSRNMSCGAILPLTSYRSNSAAAAASAALAFNRTARVNTATLSSATTTTTSNMPASTGCSFSSNSKDETEMIVSVSLEHIASSDQDEEREEQADERTTAPEMEEDEKDQQKKDWAAATQSLDKVKASTAPKRIDEEDESLGTKLHTFHIEEEESANDCNALGNEGGGADRELQRRNGNNNVDLTNALPMSYIGTAV